MDGGEHEVERGVCGAITPFQLRLGGRAAKPPYPSPIKGEGFPESKIVTASRYTRVMPRAGSRSERLDRWLGTLLARVAGTIAAIGGVGAAWSVLTLEDFTLAAYWPVLAMAAVLLIVARMCFTARPSFLDMMSEAPLSRGEAEARRRDVAVDDQRGSEHQRRDRDERAEER